MHNNQSYWDDLFWPRQSDWLIVGSGIVGLAAAIEAKKRWPAERVVVLERDSIPGGASLKNAGFACFGSLSELLDDTQSLGPEALIALAQKRIDGLAHLRQLCQGQDIGYQALGGYEVFTPALESLYDSCASQREKVNDWLQPLFEEKVFRLADDRLSTQGLSGFKHMIFNPYEGQLHTGKMMQALLLSARRLGVEVLFGADVAQWSEGSSGVEVALKSGRSLRARQLILATNGFSLDLLPELELRPTRAQVLISEKVPKLALRGSFHMDRGYYYFRNIEERILLGGARQLALEDEYTTDPRSSAPIQEALEDFLGQLHPQPLAVERRWTGLMATGPHKEPLLRRHSEHCAIAVRLGGMGVAIGSLLGREVVHLMRPA